jgi:hypothetical protein
MTVSPDTLWPPNHKMVDVTVVPTVHDDRDGAVACTIASVSSSEPVADDGTSPDWDAVTGLTARLRAERAGNGNGRIYTLTLVCTDAAGNRASRNVAVTVPHDQRR